MVLASKPVASVMRLAARPVGAHSKSFAPFADRMRRMALTSVVLPTPGPPVMTRTLEVSASMTADLWLSANTRPVRCSIQGIALSGSIHGQGSLPFLSCSSRSAMPRSALYRPARKTQSLSPTLLATTVPSADGTVVANRVGDRLCVFLAGLYRAERGIADRLLQLRNGKLPWPRIDPDKAIPWIEQRTGLVFAES